ncbi:MAG TPA: ATP-binding protein, partial [Alphaproteobacteria bacterium]|nr:ATP-binding protein [Alphaproteobacteria bacterium]
YLTGGIGNTFYVLLLAPIMIGASLLPKKQMALLLTLGMTCTLYISFFHLSLEWPDVGIEESKLRMIAESLGLAITLVFASFYSWQISEETRNMQKASFAARTALLKQKQLQALGAQAAAAVHELGSPLATISIITKELYNDMPECCPTARDDFDTLIAQTERCRQILSNFGKTLKSDPTYMSGLLKVKTMLQNIADGFLLERPEIRFIIIEEIDGKAPNLPQSPEITHGLGVFIQNAIQFARTKVNVTVTTAASSGLDIVVEDDGPGFSPIILSKLGEPYTSSRLDNGKNMGLGVFIAQTLLEETGATISYNNKKSGGAKVVVHWPKRKHEDLLIGEK